MPRKPSLSCLLIAGVCATGLAAATDEERTVTIVLPRGDVAAGRAAFIELSCTSCHRVSGDPQLPAPVSADRGPDLGTLQAMQRPGQLATSIIQPSHQIIEAVDNGREDALSPMGDYSRSMTVRQLIDLLAYIRARR